MQAPVSDTYIKPQHEAPINPHLEVKPKFYICALQHPKGGISAAFVHIVHMILRAPRICTRNRCSVCIEHLFRVHLYYWRALDFAVQAGVLPFVMFSDEALIVIALCFAAVQLALMMIDLHIIISLPQARKSILFRCLKTIQTSAGILQFLMLRYPTLPTQIILTPLPLWS